MWLPFLGFAIFFFLLLILALCVVMYVFKSYTYYTMGRNRGFRYAWLGWIPGANMYLLGGLVGDFVILGKWRIPFAAFLLVALYFGLSLLTTVLGAVPVVGLALMILCSILWAVYYYAALYQLFRIYAPEKAKLFLILGIFFPVCLPFFLFAIRKNTPDFALIKNESPRRTLPCTTLEMIGMTCAGIGILLAFMNTGEANYVGALAILFGILARIHAKDQGDKTTFAAIAIAGGAVAIGLAGILGTFGMVWHPASGLEQSLQSLFNNLKHGREFQNYINSHGIV